MLKHLRGKILHVDLSTKTREIIEPDPKLYQQYLGGRGLAQVYYSAFAARDYTYPGMPLLLFAGALAGSGASASDFASLMTKSPASGTMSAWPVAEWGRKLRSAGVDGLIISGRSNRPCGIRLKKKEVFIEDASDYAGFSFGELSSALGKKEGLACIGKASENSVLFSCPVFDGKVTGRGGLGLVWASKNLKYLIVEEGEVEDSGISGAVESANQDVLRLLMASPVLTGEYGIGTFGDAALLDLVNAKSFLPSCFHTRTCYREIEKINAPAFHRKYKPSKHSCRNCPVGCGYADSEGRSFPDYEAIAGFGALLDNPDMESILAAHTLCNDEGLESLGAASVLAFYLKQKRMSLSAGDLPRWIEKIIRCEEEGYLLAKGTFRYALSSGMEDQSLTVKGMDLPLFDPRGAFGLALSYATGPMGPSIHTAFPLSHELLRKPFATDRFSWDMKAKMLVISEDTHAAAHCLGVCTWALLSASLEEYSRVFNAVYETEVTAQDLLRIGGTVFRGERFMNQACGIGGREDALPEFYFQQEDGGVQSDSVSPLHKKDFLDNLEIYNRIRGG